MKNGTKWLGLLAAVLGASLLAPALAQEGPDDEMEGAEQEQWKEFARTGPEHAAFQKLTGDWTCEIKCWKDADSEPAVSKGQARYSTVLGGRYLKEDFNGQLHDEAVMGIGYLGYNKANGKFETTWLDTMGTGMLRLSGTETVQGKEWQLEGTRAAPNGGKISVRAIFRQPDADHRVLEMHCDRGDGEFKSMEISYTRGK